MPNFHHLLPENGSLCNGPTVLSDIAESSNVGVFSLYFELPRLGKLAKPKILL